MPLSQLIESRCRDLQAELADARRTIDALRQSEEKFRRILANMPDVTWTSDQYGRMTYLSPKVEGLFGYSSEEVRASGGDLWLGRVHPDDSGRVIQAYWALFENRITFDEEYRIQRKDGAWIWVHDRAIRTHEENGLLYADGIFCDVTARKLAEEELRSKTVFLEAQANSTIDGILVVDERGQRILQNQRLAELFKIPYEILADPDDRRMLGFVVAAMKDADSFLARVQYLYSDPNETSRDEIEFKDGTIFDRYSSPVVDKNGKHYGRIWTFRDITERKRNEDMLQQLSMAVEQSAVSVVITDPQGNISYVNRKFTEVTGYTANEVLGKNPRVLNSGRCAPETYKELWSAITQGREWRGEFCNRRKNGDIFWEAATITPITNPKGVITHFLAIKEDITERRVLESQLRQAQKLEGIGQLAAGIAHEINTPTQFVTDNLTFLRDSWKAVYDLLEHYRGAVHDANGKLPPAVASALEQAERICDLDFIASEVPRAIDQGLDGARRVAKIVRAMKEFSHPDSADKIAADLNQAIESTITVARNEWKYVAEISTQFEENLPPVVCYAGEINQVILNLVVNAAHSIKEKLKDGEKGGITVRTKTRGEFVEISITDTGTGIPEAIRSRVFEPFFTTKEVGKGTGQGLALAHSVIVKKHQGKIWFETEMGCGTTFFIDLPVTATRRPQEN
jgi:PAS domain S-box-containing protein